MRHRQRILALFLPLLLAGPAAAQSDMIGVYFDLEATYGCWDCIGPGQTLSAYLILTDLSAPPAAVQARVTYPVPPNAFDLGFYPLGNIVWIAPRFEGGKLASPARVTVFHNGVVVHHDTELTGPTTHRKVLEYEPHPEVGPLDLQDHGNPVRFRNIWYRPLKGYDE